MTAIIKQLSRKLNKIMVESKPQKTGYHKLKIIPWSYMVYYNKTHYEFSLIQLQYKHRNTSYIIVIFFRLSALSNFFENEAGHNGNNSLPELDQTKNTEIQFYKWFHQSKFKKYFL